MGLVLACSQNKSEMQLQVPVGCFSMLENHYMDFVSFADLSHFELVIEQLKQVAAQEKKNLKRENSVDFTGLDEQVEDMTLKTNVCLLVLLFSSFALHYKTFEDIVMSLCI